MVGWSHVEGVIIVSFDWSISLINYIRDGGLSEMSTKASYI